VRFFAECVALILISIIGRVIARRVRWDLFGSIFAAGMFAVLVGLPVTFLGWLASRSEWFGQSRSILWIGGALLIGGFLMVQLALFFHAPPPPAEIKQSPKTPLGDQEKSG
jgi:hypothetical protein